jgi:hypothetical protein
MKKWFRLNIVVPALLGVVGVAMAAFATSSTYFQATGTITATDAYTEITQTDIHMTTGTDYLRFSSGDDRIYTSQGDDHFDMGADNDYIDLSSGTDTSEVNRIIFHASGDYPTEGESALTEIHYDESTDDMEVRVNSGDFIIKFGS